MNVTPTTPVTIPSGQFHEIYVGQGRMETRESRSHEVKTPVQIDHENVALANRRAELEAELEALEARQTRLDRAYAAVGGWTRAYLVDNTNGHVHSSTACSSCYATTKFLFLPDYSASDEAEIVTAAGENACTVCYPDAPVNAGPSAIRTTSQIQAAERAQERAAKSAAADEASVVTPRGKVYKSERAALNEASSEMASILMYSADHPSMSEWVRTVNENISAVAAKTGQTAELLLDQMAERVAKRHLAEARKYNKTSGAVQFGRADELPVAEGMTRILARLAV